MSTNFNFICPTQAHFTLIKHFFLFLILIIQQIGTGINPVAMIVETRLPFCYDTILYVEGIVFCFFKFGSCFIGLFL